MSQLLRLRSNGRVLIENSSPVRVEDSLEEEHGPYTKRFRSSSSFHLNQQLSAGNEFLIPPSQYNPLNEPSPLGLRLRKSPSLVDLIQTRLSQPDASSVAAAPGRDLNSGIKKDAKATATAGATDKLKASNFAASLLRIGSWEYVSRYDGDLVAKCYFAKHKLVWEILQSGLKSKIEVQWSDIMSLKANCPDEGPGTLTVVLSRQPLFFRETNPQPRKHTLWQASTDFTDGQASRYRQHFLQCPQGLLNKHYEKLLQCDTRLNFLSQQPQIALDSPCFEIPMSLGENPDQLKVSLNQLGNLNSSAIAGFQEVSSTTSASSSLSSEQQNYFVKEAPSTSSGNRNFEVYNFQGLKNQEQLKMPGLEPSSMSMSGFVNCVGNNITSGNLPEEEASESQEMLDRIAQALLSDTQCTSDEKSLMRKVNSLCCFLEEDFSTASSSQTQAAEENNVECPIDAKEQEKNVSTSNGGGNPGPSDENSMSSKDSFGDFLLDLPRIASIPNFLFDIAEDGE